MLFIKDRNAVKYKSRVILYTNHLFRPLAIRCYNDVREKQETMLNFQYLYML